MCYGKENTDQIPLLSWIIKIQPAQLLFALEDEFIFGKVTLSIVHLGCTEPVFKQLPANT